MAGVLATIGSTLASALVGKIVNSIGSHSSAKAVNQSAWQQGTTTQYQQNASTEQWQRVGSVAGQSQLANAVYTTPTGVTSVSNADSQNSANAWNTVGDIAGQAINVLGTLIQNQQVNASSARQMAYNSAEAAANRNWQEYMSNTSYQRGVADLKAAGLNPVLAAYNGYGANTGSGATASAGLGSYGQATSASRIGQKAANVQAMYEYGNATAEMYEKLTKDISTAKEYGDKKAESVLQSIVNNNMSSGYDLNESLKEQTENYSREQNTYAYDLAKAGAEAYANSKNKMGGGKGTGKGGGRGR